MRIAGLRGVPLQQQFVEIHVGRQKAAVSMAAEHAQRGVRRAGNHVGGLPHRRDKMILIGGEKQRGNAQCGQVLPHVVAGQDPQPIQVPGARGGCRQRQKPLDLIAMRMRRVESPGGQAPNKQHGFPGYHLQSGDRRMQFCGRRDTREGVEDDELPDPAWVCEGEAHRQRATERLANDDGRSSVRGRALQVSGNVGDQRVHVERFVAEAVGYDTEAMRQQARLSVEQQPRAVEARDVDQRRSIALYVQARGIVVVIPMNVGGVAR